MILLPVLVLLYVDGHLALDTDACNVQVGCVLLQQQLEKISKQLGYWSRCMTMPKQAYNTTQHEFPTLVWSIMKLGRYLEESPFTVRTDYKCLQWILNLADATGTLDRWRPRLSKFEINVVHWVGVKHCASHALSHMSTDGTGEPSIKDKIPVSLSSTTSKPNLKLHTSLYAVQPTLI